MKIFRLKKNDSGCIIIELGSITHHFINPDDNGIDFEKKLLKLRKGQDIWMIFK